MTTRLAMAVALLLVLLAQAWGLVMVWRDDPLPRLVIPHKKAATAQTALPERRLSLQPVSPGVLPDFNQGYIFNAERNLAGGGGKDGQSQNAGNVGMDKVQYSGSIIAGDNTKALLSYPLGGQAVAPPGGGAVAQKQGFLRVVVGDTVNGHKVTEILPEKITFSRGGQKITKLLYDKTKERMQVQTQSAREPNAPIPAVSQARQSSPKQNEPPVAAPLRQLLSPPSDEELRKTPLRKRLEPQKDPQVPNAKNLFQMLIEKQQQHNQAQGKGEKNDAQ
ncbi:MAG: hypothetical protein WC256_10805 [Desulfurivibrionaceae bacterium]|jgi:hypothetical protein